MILENFGPSQYAAYIPFGEGSSPNVVRMLTSFERLKLKLNMNLWPFAAR
jgi:hypothetical protein